MLGRKYYQPVPRRKSYVPKFVLLLIFAVVIIVILSLHNYATNANNQKSVFKAHVDNGLNSLIESWANEQNDKYGVSVIEINGSTRTAGYQSEKQFATASTYKMFVAYMTLHNIEHGIYSLKTRTMTGKNVGDCLTITIINSDNDCGKALGFLAGWVNITNNLRPLGITNTDLNNYVGRDTDPTGEKYSTPDDEATLLQLLSAGKLLSAQNTNLLLDLIKRQVHRERIPAGVPTGVAVANKPGWNDNVQNDMAIVYGPKSTYILVIMSDGNNPTPLANLSELIYNYLQQ